MVRALSNDLRKRVVAAVSKGESCRSAALRFGVAVSSVVKWSQRYRTTGSVEPDRMGRQRKSVLDRHGAFIKGAAQADPAFDAPRAEGRVGGARGSKSRTMRCGCSCAARDCGSKKRCSLLSKAALMWPADGDAGDRGRLALIHSASSSSTIPGSRPTWLRCADGRRKELAFAASHHRATGAR